MKPQGNILVLADCYGTNNSVGRCTESLVRAMRAYGYHPHVLHLQHSSEVSPDLQAIPSRKLRWKNKTYTQLTWPTYASEVLSYIQDQHIELVHFFPLGLNKSGALIQKIKERSIPICGSFFIFDFFCEKKLAFHRDQICQQCVGGHFARSVVQGCSLTPKSWINVLSRPRLQGAFPHFDALFYPRNNFCQALQRFGARKDQLIYSPIPFDDLYYDFHPILGDHFFYFGQNLEEKGFHFLPRLAEMNPEAKFVLCYLNSSQTKSIRQAVTKLQSLPNCELHENSPFSTVHRLLETSRAVILPTRWSSPVEYTLIESLLCHKPIITFNVGAHAEVLQHEREAFLVEPDNLNSMSASIASLARNQPLALAMSQQAAETIHRLLPELKQSPSIFATYDRLLHREEKLGAGPI